MDDEIVKLKAEIFDLQVTYCETKKKLDEKLKQLNILIAQKNAKP